MPEVRFDCFSSGDNFDGTFAKMFLVAASTGREEIGMTLEGVTMSVGCIGEVTE